MIGFEHSIANLYLVPACWIAGASLSIPDFLPNLLRVTLGNVVSGVGGVALAYCCAYERFAPTGTSS